MLSELQSSAPALPVRPPATARAPLRRRLVEAKSPSPPPEQKELQGLLARLAAGFGLSGALYVHLGHAIWADGAANPTTPARFVAVSPLDRTLYLEGGGVEADPLARRAFFRHAPFAWTSSVRGADGRGNWLAGRLRRRGVHGGVAIPVQDHAAGPAYVALCSGFSGEAEQVIQARGAELAYAGAIFHETAKAALPIGRPANDCGALTAREIDCLRLAALGRTVAETAGVLQVTARTVEFHLRNAAAKLCAANKLHAVATAISAGLIAL